jgi:hypothetical protein
LIKARNKVKRTQKHLHTTQKTFQSMVVTTNMEEFISNIRNERMNQFWNDTKKFQKFSPTPEEIIENTPPETFDDAEELLRPTLPYTCHTNMWYGPHRGHQDSGRFETPEKACEYAIQNNFQCVYRAPTGKVFYFRYKHGNVLHEEIISGLYASNRGTIWTVKCA